MPPTIDATVSEYGAWEPLRIYGAHPFLWGLLIGAGIFAAAYWWPL